MTRQPEDEELHLIDEPLSDDLLSTPSPSSILVAWEDLPTPGQFEESESHNRAQLLKDHNIDEYFLEDEFDWNQDDSGIWLREAADSSLQLGSSEERDSGASDLDMASFQGSPSTPSPYAVRISTYASEPDEDLCYSDQSQEDAVAIHDSASPEHSAELDTCRESALFALLASQDHVASDAFSSHSRSGIMCDMEEDLGPPLDGDEDEGILCEMSAVGDNEEAFSIWEDW